jgi:Bax protein
MMGRVRRRRSRREMARGAVLLTGLATAMAYLALGAGHLRASLPQSGDVPSVTERLASIDRPEILKTSFSAASVAHLTEMFHQLGYDLATVRSERQVPRVFLGSLPTDLGNMQVVEKRKRVFLRAVLPLVLHVNEVIRGDRKRVLALQAQVETGGALSEVETAWLARVADDYGLEPDAGFADILSHVDVIPPSLALAQAAVESGWGTSRFAQEANALFGQYTWNDDGLVPLARDAGKTHRVRAFDYLVDAVKAYAINLNSNPAYKTFRKLRARMRTDDRAPDGYALAQTLDRYSARGDAYVKELCLTIRANDLRALDEARLSRSLTVRVADADPAI